MEEFPYQKQTLKSFGFNLSAEELRAQIEDALRTTISWIDPGKKMAQLFLDEPRFISEVASHLKPSSGPVELKEALTMVAESARDRFPSLPKSEFENAVYDFVYSIGLKYGFELK